MRTPLASAGGHKTSGYTRGLWLGLGTHTKANESNGNAFPAVPADNSADAAHLNPRKYLLLAPPQHSLRPRTHSVLRRNGAQNRVCGSQCQIESVSEVSLNLLELITN